MGSIDIFSSISNLYITLVSLGVFLISVLYSAYRSEISKGIWYMFIGFLFELTATWISSKIPVYEAAGHSINIIIFIELSTLLISMAFLALAASYILSNNISDMPIIAAIAGLGFVAIIYFVTIHPDGDMVNRMRQIFSLSGFAYLATAFWTKSFQKNKTGYILASLTVSVVTLISLMRLFSIGIIISQNWYTSSLIYVLLSVSFLMIKSDSFIRKLRESRRQLERYNQRIEEIIKSSPFPIIISRLSDDRLLLANNNAKKLFGIHENELDRYKLKDFFADSENRHLLNERLEQEKEVQDFEILVKTPAGDTPFWLLTSANVIDYNYDIAIYAAFQDITSRKNREVILKNQAVRDPLTSLYNRRYFEEEVSKRILEARVNNKNFSVLMVDADHFKNVNDTYGHKTGDKVLIELASSCEDALRPDDIVARYGGEEFVIYLANVNADQAKFVAERLRETIASRVVYSEDDKPIKFTVSIGISSSDVSDNIETLIKTSDEALYRAKENGRNRAEIFTLEDLKHFAVKEEKTKPNDQRHPIFAKEGSEEISLLDGVGAAPILNEKTDIETPSNPSNSNKQN